MNMRTINHPWTDEDIELLSGACEAYGTKLPKDPRDDPNWTDREYGLVIRSLEKQIVELRKFLHEVEGSITDDLIRNQEYLYNKYKKLYEIFALGTSPQL
jgi:hypothetical protein